jgi:hypothetical protein
VIVENGRIRNGIDATFLHFQTVEETGTDFAGKAGVGNNPFFSDSVITVGNLRMQDKAFSLSYFHMFSGNDQLSVALLCEKTLIMRGSVRAVNWFLMVVLSKVSKQQRYRCAIFGFCLKKGKHRISFLS